ncbi:uncharacterized protein [Amphiura filiformis]|uniref:uncharacterized protein n=1 Tax=Amphiura filiformis TaxID=82378 RepID=UPI003B20EFF9
MCLPVDCLGILPLLWLVTMPLFGSFCGPESVLRLSLLMLIHTLIGSALPNALTSVIPFFQIGLFGVLLSVPINLVPYLFLWVYDKLIWLAEPVFLTIEAVEVVRISVRTSLRMSNRINEQPFLMKFFILGATAICYAGSLAIALILWSQGTNAIRWIIVSLAIVGVILLIATLAKEEGIISDCAVVTLAMFVILWAMHLEFNMMKNPMKVPQVWQRYMSTNGEGQSFLQLLLAMATKSLADVNQALQFLKKLFSASFLFLMAIRVGSVLHSVSVFIRALNFRSDEYEDSTNLNVNNYVSCWESRLAIKLALIFVYTQLVVYNIEVNTTPLSYTASGPIMRVATKGLFRKVGASRLMQLCVLLGTYGWRLHHADEFVYDDY